jgi:hypothetical protein
VNKKERKKRALIYLNFVAIGGVIKESDHIQLPPPD